MSETPAVIGRYEVERQLGEGGMGVLYLARDPLLDRHVALKLLRVDSVDLRRRFVREAQSAARLQHPNIVTVYDVGDHDGQLYIAMEYIDGDTLATLIRDNVPFSHIRKLDIIDEVAEGLGFAHQRGIIHRDIKPANLMMTRGGLVKVLDFGIARVAHRQSGEIDGPTLVGTPAYMAPEQLEGLVADARSDIYAVGLVMYELFSRRRAFSASTTADVIHLVLDGHPTPLTRLVPSIDPELARIVGRAMARNPDDRYPDLQALRKDLARMRRQALQASSDDATIVVGMPAMGGVHVATPPVPPPTTKAGETPAPPLTGSAPPMPVPLPGPASVPRPAEPPAAGAAPSPPPPPTRPPQTAEDVVLARLAAERTSKTRPPVPPADEEYEATIISPVPAFDPSWAARAAPASGGVPVVTGEVRPATSARPASTAGNVHERSASVDGPETRSGVSGGDVPVTTGGATAAPDSPAAAPPPLPVPLPASPSAPPAAPPSQSPPRRSSPPRSPSTPAVAPLDPAAPAAVSPAAAAPSVFPAPPAAVPSPAAPPSAVPTAASPGPIPAAPDPHGVRTAVPPPAKRQGVPALVLVAGLVAFLGICFLGAFLVVRALGVFEGPSLLSRLWPRADTTSTKVDPPPADPPATEPPAPTPEPPPSTATEEPLTEPATTSVVPTAPAPAAVDPEPPAATTSAATTSVAPVSRPESRALPKQSPRPPLVVATRPPATPPAEEAQAAEAVTRAEPPAVRPEPVEAEPEAPREEAIALVRAYVAARNTSHASGIRRVWPTVDDVHLRRVTSSFSAPLTLSNCSVEASGRQRAVATCQLTQPGTTGIYAQGQAVTIRRSFTFDLERQGRSWVITGLRE